MASTKQVIHDALSELLEEEFGEFKWHLSKGETQDESISRGKLENANRHNVVDLMEQPYGLAKAGMIAVKVLRKTKQNNLADRLKGKLPEVPEEVSCGGEGGGPSRAEAAPASTAGVTVTITSNGGTVKAPVIHGGVFNGPMTFN